MALRRPSSVWTGGATAGTALVALVLAIGLPERGCGGAIDDEELTDDLVQTCSAKKPMKVHFYMVEQGLSALIDLPDGRHVLVDAGAAIDAPGCGYAACKIAHEHLVSMLERDLAGKPIDLLWITHQHQDHIGGAADLINHFTVKQMVDNGRDLAVPQVVAAHAAAQARHTTLSTVDPVHLAAPLASTKALRLRAMVPSKFVQGCNSDENMCSIGLRVDYCNSSVLFTGDAELQEEALLDPMGPATLLQLGHHGSDTSSGAPFLAKVQPKMAVISAGRPGFGMNRSYCHPRASTIQRVTELLGGPGSKTISGFDASVSCIAAPPSTWIAVPASDRLFATERDGDLVFTTSGDGTFTAK